MGGGCNWLITIVIISQIKKSISRNNDVTISLNVFGCGMGSSFFYPMGSPAPSCPVSLLGFSAVTQIIWRPNRIGKKCTYFSQASYLTLAACLGETRGQLKGSVMWLSGFNLAQKARHVFSEGERPRETADPEVYLCMFLVYSSRLQRFTDIPARSLAVVFTEPC